jgi:hypothetical protein
MKRTAVEAKALNEQVGNVLLPLVKQHLAALNAYQPGVGSQLPLQVTRKIVEAWENNSNLDRLYDHVSDPNNALWLKEEVSQVRDVLAVRHSDDDQAGGCKKVRIEILCNDQNGINSKVTAVHAALGGPLPSNDAWRLAVTAESREHTRRVSRRI